MCVVAFVNVKTTKPHPVRGGVGEWCVSLLFELVELAGGDECRFITEFADFV